MTDSTPEPRQLAQDQIGRGIYDRSMWIEDLVSGTGYLDMSISDLFAGGRNPVLSRIVNAVMLDSGDQFIDAMERVHEAVERAYKAGKPTAREVLDGLGEGVADRVKLLDRRDEMVERVYRSAQQRIMLDVDLDDEGRVKLLDAPTARKDSDPSLILGGDPMVLERRLARLRKLEPGKWDGEAGRERFRTLDHKAADQGHDLVRSTEIARELEAARVDAHEVGAKLDAAIAVSPDKGEFLRELEQVISSDATRLKALTADLTKRQGPLVPVSVKQLDDQRHGTLKGPDLSADARAVIDRAEPETKTRSQLVAKLLAQDPVDDAHRRALDEAIEWVNAARVEQ